MPHTPRPALAFPRRGRNPKMDELLARINGSPRFSFDAVCQSVSQAMAAHRAGAAGQGSDA